MFPASIYPRSVYPDSLYPGAGGSVVAPTGVVGIYPRSIFPASLFAPSIFPGSSTGSILPDDLVDAVVAVVQTAMVQPGALSWFGTGMAPAGQGLPYAELAEPDEDDTYWTTLGDGLADGHLLLTAYASTKKAARGLGDQLAAGLQDAPLVFRAGRLVYLRQVGRTASLDPDPAPDGGDCWSEVRQFRYLYSY